MFCVGRPKIQKAGVDIGNHTIDKYVLSVWAFACITDSGKAAGAYGIEQSSLNTERPRIYLYVQRMIRVHLLIMLTGFVNQ